MSLARAYGKDRFGLSFELFPPKTASGLANLYEHVARLASFEPSYITCTYGAGGSTQERTLEVIAGVLERYSAPVATHLTCVGRTREQIADYLTRARELGIENVVALRGDPPQGDTKFRPVPGGFSYANELVTFIRERFATLGIAVAGYPETHREAPSPEIDLDHLKRKVDAGADVIITQLFYDNADFFRFRDRCQAAAISAPLAPGLLPVTNLRRSSASLLCAERNCLLPLPQCWDGTPTTNMGNSRWALSSPPNRPLNWSVKARQASTSTCSTNRPPPAECWKRSICRPAGTEAGPTR